ncbi:hypothetical protein [Streptomyces nojiriensis]|uniref:hypothetical protein n=1 Tax=Streptomyces nojiriensis TaxID=66374 RepID=UPI0035E1D38A
MTLLEMGGADDQGCLAGRPEGAAPRGAVVVVFGVVAAAFVAAAVGFVAMGVVFVAVGGVFVAAAAVFAWGVADRVAVRGADDEDDGPDGGGADAGAGVGGREGCTGMPMAGASACTPIRLLPMATARTAPTTETGHPMPLSRRPRRPDWSTNTGAGADSRKFDSAMSDSAWCADQRSTELMRARTLRGLSAQGTQTAGQQGER